MRPFELLALGPPPGTEQDPRAGFLHMLGMFVILGVMFYFLLIRPQQKQRKEHEAMLRNIRSGDEILTTGGIYGIVTNVKEKELVVKIADHVKVRVAKSAVSAVVKKSAEPEPAAAEKK
jgi:preprotein translocase subunit YajC